MVVEVSSVCAGVADTAPVEARDEVVDVLRARVAQALGVRVTVDMGLDELVGLLIVNRDRYRRYFRFVVAENTRLRARVDVLECSADLVRMELVPK